MYRSQVFLDLLSYTSNHEEAAAKKQEEYCDAQENAEAHERVGQVVLLVGWCGGRRDLAAMRQVEALAHDIVCVHSPSARMGRRVCSPRRVSRSGCCGKKGFLTNYYHRHTARHSASN